MFTTHARTKRELTVRTSSTFSLLWWSSHPCFCSLSKSGTPISFFPAPAHPNPHPNFLFSFGSSQEGVIGFPLSLPSPFSSSSFQTTGGPFFPSMSALLLSPLGTSNPHAFSFGSFFPFPSFHSLIPYCPLVVLCSSSSPAPYCSTVDLSNVYYRPTNIGIVRCTVSVATIVVVGAGVDS